MKKLNILIGLIWFAPVISAQPSVNYNDVAVIVNSNSQTSINIGNYFAQQRNIPGQNIISIAANTAEEIDSTEFEQVRQQIENFLVVNNLTDSINYIVTTKGVPLKVQRGVCDSVFGFFNCASFDTELSLILGSYSSDIALPGGSTNFYFNSNSHFSRSGYGIYLVTRLDGYTEADVLNLIDHSGPNTAVNKLTSNFIFDISNVFDSTLLNFFTTIMQGPYDSLTANGWNTTLDTATSLLTNQQNVLGYYSVDYQPANQIVNNTWSNGSIADILFGFSARTFNTAANINNDLLIANLISEGATGANGYAYYTYAGSSLNDNILFNKYTDTVSHYNLAESFYMSIPLLSWQNIVIGDPKTSIIIDNTSSINDQIQSESINIFPNPFTSEILISLQKQNLKQATITIKNILGQAIFMLKENNLNGPFKKTIDLNALSKGIYLLDITVDGEQTVKKIVKK